MDTETIATAQSPSLPPIVFSEWTPWVKRNEVPGCNWPGVYLLARFTDSPAEQGKADPLSPHIVLIGESRKSLRGRWNQFHGAAFRGGKGSHSEGHRYREKQYPQAMEALHVAAMPSSPLQWRGWASLDDEELAQMLSGQKGEVVSTEDVRQFKRYLESSAPAREKGALNGVWIKFVERKLILDFVLKWGSLPECNAE